MPALKERTQLAQNHSHKKKQMDSTLAKIPLTTLNLCFPSDLLSSDYVEIHYEGGKPVLSKVMFPPVVTECIFLVFAGDGSAAGRMSHARLLFLQLNTMTHRLSWSLLYDIGILTKGEGMLVLVNHFEHCCGCQALRSRR